VKPGVLSITLRQASGGLSALLVLLALAWAGNSQAAACPDLLRHSFTSLQNGTPQNLCQYQGKVILVVNTASYCGFTEQFGGLEALNRKYKDRGLVILGFPSNDFGRQEPGSSREISKFCRLTYGVEFPMLEKSNVVGDKRNGFYAALERRSGQKPRWNFHKYLIDHQAAQVLSFESSVTTDDPRLLEKLHKLLGARKTQLRKT